MGPDLYRDHGADNSDPGQMPEIIPKGDDPPLCLGCRNTTAVIPALGAGIHALGLDEG